MRIPFLEITQRLSGDSEVAESFSLMFLMIVRILYFSNDSNSEVVGNTRPPPAFIVNMKLYIPQYNRLHPHCGPWHSYVSPTKPSGLVDSICWEHDVEYGKLGWKAYYQYSEADEKFIKRLEEVGGLPNLFYGTPFKVKGIIWKGLGYEITRGDHLIDSIVDITTATMPKRKRTSSVTSRKRVRGQLVGRKYNPLKPTGYYDVDGVTTPTVINTTATVFHLNDVAAGTTVTSRIGKKIKALSLEFYGDVECDIGASIHFMRVALIWDRRPLSTLPAYTDIYQSNDHRSPLKDENSSRFKLIKSWDFMIAGASTGQLDHPGKVLRRNLKLNKYVEYGAAGTGAIGDVSTGALYLVTMGSIGAGTADATLKYRTRLRFHDLPG
jgi:hypothetical protein